MIRNGLLSIAAALFLLSCGRDPVMLPYAPEEADELAREIRINSVKPDEYVLDLFEAGNTVNLVDVRGYGEGLEVMKYLVPLLHSEGITALDLRFIPRDGMVQANALLNSSRFFELSAAELAGRTGYLYLYREYVDFMRYLYDFNHTLGEGEEKIVLADLPAEEVKGLVYSFEPVDDTSRLLIQNPSALKRLADEGEPTLEARMAQLFGLLEGEAPFFVMGPDHFMREKGGGPALLVLAEPGSILPCRPYEGGINRSNCNGALSDFPEQIFTGPPGLAIFFMERAQRKFLRNLD